MQRLVVPIDKVMSRFAIRSGKITDFVVRVPVRCERLNRVLEHIGFGVLGRGDGVHRLATIHKTGSLPP